MKNLVSLNIVGWKRLRRGLRDPWTVPLFLGGGIGLAVGPDTGFENLEVLPLLMGKAFFEELTFRALAQQQLDKLCAARDWGWKKSPLTSGNICVSLLFALLHLQSQPLPAALSIFFPSLALGLAWTRSKSLWLCVALHIWYNVCYRY